MLNIQLEILSIAFLTSLACVLPGLFLVLRGVALMSDAISHAILFGIVIMFLIVQRLDSPLLIIGAALSGLLTVFCTEALIHARQLKKDAAIGIVFPLLFSIGVILVSRYARNVHLDTDMILLGELAFAPFKRIVLCGYDIGPYAFWSLLIVVLINSIFITVFWKELKMITLDQDYAQLLGFRPLLLYYVLMMLTSITAVVAFDIVGAVVVVAMMITPAAIALLLTNSLFMALMLSIFFGGAACNAGYALAHWFDVSIAGSIATMLGLLFFITLFFSPEKGVVVRLLQKGKRI